MTTAHQCRDCGADLSDPEHARCSRCVLKILTRTTTLDRVARYHCEALRKDGGEPDESNVSTSMSYAIAMTLAYPEWAAAVLLEEWGINGETLPELIEEMADGIAERFPVVPA